MWKLSTVEGPMKTQTLYIINSEKLLKEKQDFVIIRITIVNLLRNVFLLNQFILV